MLLLGCQASWPEDVVLADDPLQAELEPQKVANIDGYELTGRARFAADGLVLSTRRYRRGAEAELSPIDVALGWGPMADAEVLGALDISQSGRFYRYRWRNAPPIPQREIVEHSTNIHTIAANPTIRRALRRLDRGDVVRLEGLLVDVDRADGWRWRTSLTRSDSGAGACEILYVTAVQVLR